MTTIQNTFLRTLQGEILKTPPVWFMRQAGRYLPEYLAVRADAGSFLDLCYNPEKAAEVTLQPIERFDLDAAILFADILLVPQALGADVWFETGEGPRIAPPLMTQKSLSHLSGKDIHKTLGPVYETIAQVRAKLPKDKALIGFAGAPWTVATYMIAGQGSKDPSALRLFAYQNSAVFDGLMALLVEATADYLIRQIDAGVQAIQLFDSWASGLPEDFFTAYCLKPVQEIAQRVKEKHPDIPFIAFPRGSGALYPSIARLPEVDAISIDTGLPWDFARKHLSPHVVVQGGLDQLLIIEGGEPMLKAARELIKAFSGVPFIFNTGHGFIPQTPPENVAALVAEIRKTTA